MAGSQVVGCVHRGGDCRRVLDDVSPRQRQICRQGHVFGGREVPHLQVHESEGLPCHRSDDVHGHRFQSHPRHTTCFLRFVLSRPRSGPVFRCGEVLCPGNVKFVSSACPKFIVKTAKKRRKSLHDLQFSVVDGTRLKIKVNFLLTSFFINKTAFQVSEGPFSRLVSSTIFRRWMLAGLENTSFIFEIVESPIFLRLKVLTLPSIQRIS